MSCFKNGGSKGICACVISALTLSACLLGSSVFAQSNLITNGDFETGTLAGWTVTNPGVFDGIHNRGEYGLTAFPQGGDFFVAFNGGNQPAQATLSQLINTGAGQSYNLSFLYGAFSPFLGAVDQRIVLTVTDASSNTILVQDTIQDASASANPQLIFSSFDYSFSALSNQTLITFTDISPDSIAADGFVDNVRVVTTSVAPEPGTLSLLLVSPLVGAVALRRRKTKAEKRPLRRFRTGHCR